MNNNRTERLTAAILFCAALAVPMVCLWHAGTSILPGVPRCDFEYYFYPQRVFLSRWLGRGIFPYWNPHLFSGYPVVEVHQTALFYPLNSLSLIVFSPVFGFIFMVSLHVILAAALTWFTCEKCMDCSRLASVTAGLVYVFAAVFAYRFHAGHLTKFYIMAWIPPAIGCLAKAVRTKQPGTETAAPHLTQLHWLILAAACTGICILAGYPQYLFYLLWGQIAVVVFVTGVSWKRRLLSLLFTGLAALALSAPQWLPSAFYVPYSQRMVSFYPDTRTFRSSIATILEYLLRAPLGDGVHSVHLQARGVWETAGYCGTIAVTLVIALLAGWRSVSSSQRGPALQSIGLIAAGFYLILGGTLPGFSTFREPLKAIYLVNLGTAFCMALGLDLVFAPGRTRTPRSRLAMFSSLPLAIAGGVIACLAFTHAPQLARLLIFISEADPHVHPSVVALVEAAQSNPWVVLGPLVSACLWALTVMGLLWMFLAIARKSGRVGFLLVCVLAVGDPLLAHWHLFLPQTPVAESGWNPTTLRQLESITQPIREGSETPWRVTMPDAMVNAAELVEGLYEPRGYDPLMPQYAIGRAVLPSASFPLAEAQAIKPITLALRYRVDDLTSTVPETTPQQARKFQIAEICSTATIATLIPAVTPLESPPTYGPVDGCIHFVSAEEASRFPLQLVRSEQVSSNSLSAEGLLKYHALPSPNGYEFEVQTSSPAILLLRVTWAPGWRLRVNGLRAGNPVRTNGWMMSVPVDARTRIVRFDYRPVALTTSRVISALTALACLLACFWFRRGKATARCRDAAGTT